MSRINIHPTQNITVTCSNADGNLTATSSNTSIAVAELKSGMVEITGKSPGSCTVTVTAVGNENYNESTRTINVTVQECELISTLPVIATDTLQYTGSAQTVTLVGTDTSKYDVAGTVTATDTGIYYVELVAKQGYGWDYSVDCLPNGNAYLRWSISSPATVVSNSPRLDSTAIEAADGTVVSPVLIGFDPESMIAYGDLSASTTGNYTIYIITRDGYEWAPTVNSDSQDRVVLNWARLPVS